MDLVLRERGWIVFLLHQWRTATQQIPNKNSSAYTRSLKAFTSYKPGMTNVTFVKQAKNRNLFSLCSYHTPRRILSQLKILHFWVICIERNVCRCTFNRYSVITQSAKLAAGEQLHRRCTHNYSTSKPLKVLLKNHRFCVVILFFSGCKKLTTHSSHESESCGYYCFQILIYSHCWKPTNTFF